VFQADGMNPAESQESRYRLAAGEDPCPSAS
jgi:hypothetical protein